MGHILGHIRPIGAKGLRDLGSSDVLVNQILIQS